MDSGTWGVCGQLLQAAIMHRNCSQSNHTEYTEPQACYSLNTALVSVSATSVKIEGFLSLQLARHHSTRLSRSKQTLRWLTCMRDKERSSSTCGKEEVHAWTQKRQAQHVAKRKCNTNERMTEAAARQALCRLVCRLGNIQHQPVYSSNCSRQASKLRLCDLEDSTLPAKQVGLSRLGAWLMRPMLWEQLHIASSVSPVSCHLVVVLPHAQTQISLYNTKT